MKLRPSKLPSDGIPHAHSTIQSQRDLRVFHLILPPSLAQSLSIDEWEAIYHTPMIPPTQTASTYGFGASRLAKSDATSRSEVPFPMRWISETFMDRVVQAGAEAQPPFRWSESSKNIC